MHMLSSSRSTKSVSSPENDRVSIRPSSSSSSTSSPEFWNYLWIPFLISLSKEFVVSKASEHHLQPPNELNDFNNPPSNSFSNQQCPSGSPELNDFPVIGILTHPGDGASGRLNNAFGVSYIAASYVKFIESAGARVIPLIYNEPEEVLFEKLNLVNGVLLTGGRVKHGPYFEMVKAIFQKVLETNDKGIHFPLCAICLGFELLTMIISEDNKILEPFDAANQASTLQFIDGVNIEGTVFQRFPPELLKKLQTDSLAMQVHVYGISPERLEENSQLRNFFKVVTTSADLNEKVYVSTVQAHNYPVTGFQWHPEKNAFEWGKSKIPHSEDAVQVTQHVANFFISEARKSSNRPPAQKVLDNLIYNFSPTYCGKAGYGYDEVYIFDSQERILKSKV